MSKLNELVSLSSHTSVKDIKDHEIDIQAVTSHPVSIGDVGVQLSSEQKFLILRRLNHEGLVSLDDLPLGVLFMIEKIQGLPVQEAIQILKDAIVEHKDDVNVPDADLDLYQELVDGAPSDISFTTEPTAGIHEKLGGEMEATEQKKSEFYSDDSLSKLEASEVDFHTVFDWEFQKFFCL
mgnify:FL=1